MQIILYCRLKQKHNVPITDTTLFLLTFIRLSNCRSLVTAERSVFNRVGALTVMQNSRNIFHEIFYVTLFLYLYKDENEGQLKTQKQ